MMTDPLADMFTRIRNALLRKYEATDIPTSNLKKKIAQILKEEGYIKDFKRIDDNKSGILRVYLKYSPRGESIINKIIRVSKPGQRIYRKVDELEKVLDGLGIAIVSTSKGMMTDRACRKLKLGGEVICKVW